MSSYIVPIILLALIGALFIYVPRLIKGKRRIIAGVALLIVGYGALSLGMRLQDRPFLQNEIVAYMWLGVCVACMAVGMVSLMNWRQ